jgi:hypothetical protein
MYFSSWDISFTPWRRSEAMTDVKLDDISQSDSDHVRQVLMSNPELSLALVVARERLQLLDQPLKHVEAPAPSLYPFAASAAADTAPAASSRAVMWPITAKTSCASKRRLEREGVGGDACYPSCALD